MSDFVDITPNIKPTKKSFTSDFVDIIPEQETITPVTPSGIQNLVDTMKSEAMYGASLKPLPENIEKAKDYGIWKRLTQELSSVGKPNFANEPIAVSGMKKGIYGKEPAAEQIEAGETQLPQTMLAPIGMPTMGSRFQPETAIQESTKIEPAETTKPFTVPTRKPEESWLPKDQVIGKTDAGTIRKSDPLSAIDALKDIVSDPMKVLPFMRDMKPITELATIASSVQRVENDTATQDDIDRINRFNKSVNQDKSFWNQVVETTSIIPAFGLEFAATGGLYSLGKKSAANVGKAALKRILTESGQKLLERNSARLAGKVATSIAGGTLQTPITGIGMMAQDIIKRRTPSVKITADDTGQLTAEVTAPGETPVQAATKALANTWVEIVSEHSGGILGATAKLLPDKVVNSAIVNALKKANPMARSETMKKIASTGEFHGVWGESFEERLGEIGRATLGLEEYKLPTPEQLLVELVSFSIPGLAGKGIEKLTKDQGVDKEKKTLISIDNVSQIPDDELQNNLKSHVKDLEDYTKLSEKTKGSQFTKGIQERINIVSTIKAEIDRREMAKQGTVTEKAKATEDWVDGLKEQDEREVAELQAKQKPRGKEADKVYNAVEHGIAQGDILLEDLPALYQSKIQENKPYEADAIDQVYTKYQGVELPEVSTKPEQQKIRNDIYDRLTTGEITRDELPALAKSYQKENLKTESDIVNDIYKNKRTTDLVISAKVARYQQEPTTGTAKTAVKQTIPDLVAGNWNALKLAPDENAVKLNIVNFSNIAPQGTVVSDADGNSWKLRKLDSKGSSYRFWENAENKELNIRVQKKQKGAWEVTNEGISVFPNLIDYTLPKTVTQRVEELRKPESKQIPVSPVPPITPVSPVKEIVPPVTPKPTITETAPVPPRKPVELAKQRLQEKLIEENELLPEPEPSAIPDTKPIDKTAIVKRVPVQVINPQEVKIAPEIYQFKTDVDEKGLQAPLEGEYQPEVAGIILVHERLNGDKYIVSGHHRLDLMQRKGITEANAQIIREADGYTPEDAIRMGSIINIKEGGGTIYDHAKFIRNNPDYKPEKISTTGREGKAKTIATSATDNTYSQFVNKEISPEIAFEIAKNAPNSNLQDSGIKYANAHPKASANEVADFIQVIKLGKPEVIEQVDLFGTTTSSSYKNMTEKLSETVSELKKESKNKTAGFNAIINRQAKLDQGKEKYGIEVKNIIEARKEYAKAKEEEKKWGDWLKQPDLVNQVYERAGISKEDYELAAQNPNEVIAPMPLVPSETPVKAPEIAETALAPPEGEIVAQKEAGEAEIAKEIISYRGQTDIGFDPSIKTTHMGGLVFAAGTPETAAIYAEGQRSNITKLKITPNKLLDLGDNILDGSQDLNVAVRKALGEPDGAGFEIESLLKKHGYDAIKFRERKGWDAQSDVTYAFDSDLVDKQLQKPLPTEEAPKETVKAPETPQEKQPWEMTKTEFINDRMADRQLMSDEWVDRIFEIAGVSKGEPGLNVENPYIVFRDESGEPVGIATIRKIGNDKVISGVAVKPKYRRQGIATQIYEKASSLGYKETYEANIGSAGVEHKLSVKQALSEGKSVPPEVLADYPDLVKPEQIVMDEETYLAQHGASRQDIGEPSLHKNIPAGKIRKQILKPELERNKILLAKREELRKEYQAKIKSGEIRKPTRTETLIATANGMPELASVQAARRLLDKQGIDWKSRQIVTKKEEQGESGKDKRNQIVQTLRQESHNALTQIEKEISSLKPIGKMGEWGDILGIKPNKGEMFDTPLGNYVFAKNRQPSPEQLKRWKELYKEYDDKLKQVANYTVGIGADERPNTTIGNKKPMLKMQEFEKQGLLDKAEITHLRKLEKFWQENPDAETGIWTKSGTIEPFSPSRIIGKPEQVVTKKEEVVTKGLPITKVAEAKKRAEAKKAEKIVPVKKEEKGEPESKKPIAPIIKQESPPYVKEHISKGEVSPLHKSPAASIDLIKNGESIVLGNGWTLNSANMNGVSVIAITNVKAEDEAILKDNGVSSFKTDVYNTIYYFEPSEKIIKKLTGISPIENIQPSSSNPNDKTYLSVVAKKPTGETLIPSAIEEIMENLKLKYKGMPRHHVVPTFKDAPESLQRKAIGHENEVNGAFHNGEFWFIANRITSRGDVEKIILHEGLHKGFIDFFGTDGNKILKAVYDYYEKKDSKDLNKLADKYGLDINKEEDKRVLAHERLAKLAENPKEAPALWARVVTFVKTWLIKNGFAIRLSNNDIATLIWQSHKSLHEAQKTQSNIIVNGEVVKYSLKESPFEGVTPPYWTYALFDTTDSLTGRAIKASEEVFFIPETGQILDKMSQVWWAKKQLQPKTKTEAKKLQGELFAEQPAEEKVKETKPVISDEDQLTLFSLIEDTDPDGAIARANARLEQIRNEGSPESNKRLDSAIEEFSGQKQIDIMRDWVDSFWTRKVGTKGQREDRTVIQRIVGSPEFSWQAGNIKQLGKLATAGVKRIERTHEIYNKIMGADPETNKNLMNTINKLHRHARAEYKKSNDILLNADINKTIYFDKKDADARNELRDKMYSAKSHDERIEIQKKLNDLNERIEKDIRINLKKAGLSEDGIQSWFDFRKIADNDLDARLQQIWGIVNEFKKNDISLPTITTYDENNNKISINLREALKRMNELRDTYFPRVWERGELQAFATKTHKVTDTKGKTIEVNDLRPLMKMFPSGSLGETKRRQWAKEREREGYTNITTQRTAVKPESEVINLMGEINTVEKMIEDALNMMKSPNDKEFTKLSEVPGFTMKYAPYEAKDGTEIPQLLIITNNKVFDSAFKSIKAGRYADQTDETGGLAWHFDNPTKIIENKILDAVNSIDYRKAMQLEFATVLTLNMADVIRRSSSKSSMIARSPGVGIDVWGGYETDMRLAVTAHVQQTASGISKSEFAGKALAILHGTDEVNFNEIKKEFTQKAIDENEGKLLTEDQNNKLTKDIQKEYRKQVKENKLSPEDQPNAFLEANSYVLDQLRSHSTADAIVAGIKMTATAWYIAGNIASPMVNFTSLMTAVPGSMLEYTKFSDKVQGKDINIKAIKLRQIPVYYGKALYAYIQYMRLGKEANLSPELMHLFNIIRNKGWSQAQFNQEALTYLQSMHTKWLKQGITYLMYPFAVSEQIIRVMSVTSPYMYMMDKLKEQGVTPDENTMDLFADQAHMVSNFANGIYGPAAKPYLAQGDNVGAHAINSSYIFFKFPHTYLMLMKYLGVDKKNYKAFAWIMLAPTLIGGLGAQPLYNLLTLKPIMWLIKKLTDSDDPEEDFFDFLDKQFTGLGDWVKEGIFDKTFGISMKRSLAIEIPSFTQNIPFSLYRDLTRGAGEAWDKDYWRAAETLSPRIAKSYLRAEREYREGITTKSGMPVYFGAERIKPTAWQKAKRMAGFTPLEIEQKREAEYKGRKLTAEYEARKKAIYNRYRKYYLLPEEDQNPKVYDDILNDAKKFNQRLIDKDMRGIISPITSESIRDALRRTQIPSKYEKARARDQK